MRCAKSLVERFDPHNGRDGVNGNSRLLNSNDVFNHYEVRSHFHNLVSQRVGHVVHRADREPTTDLFHQDGLLGLQHGQKVPTWLIRSLARGLRSYGHLLTGDYDRTLLLRN